MIGRSEFYNKMDLVGGVEKEPKKHLLLIINFISLFYFYMKLLIIYYLLNKLLFMFLFCYLRLLGRFTTRVRIAY